MAPVDLVAVTEAAAALAGTAGLPQEVLAAHAPAFDGVAVDRDEAEAVAYPPHHWLLRDITVYHAVRQIAEPLVHGHGEHAEVIGNRPAMIANQQSCARSLEL